MSVIEATPAPQAPRRTGEPLLRLAGVKKHFPITRGIIRQKQIGAVHAVDGVDLEVHPGETLGLVGETGCGKSTLARVAMRLFEPTDGKIWFNGQDITQVKGDELRALRRDMQMVFQDPYASLNPRKTVGSIIGAPLKLHRTVPKDKIKPEVQELMRLVGLNPEHYNRYPHEFSGGQRQRIGVARAIALKPKLIVCDEPVSALDVSIQAQILNLLSDLQSELNLTYLFIAHDLSVVKHVSDRVAVMYLGKIAEMADKETLYDSPKHPYTGALLSAVPIADPNIAKQKKRIILEGDVPSPIDPPSGCRFHPRCYKAQELCSVEEPQLRIMDSASWPPVTSRWTPVSSRLRPSSIPGVPHDQRRRHRVPGSVIRVPDRHDPDALGSRQWPLRHVRWLQQPLGRHGVGAHPRPDHRRDGDRLGHRGLLALLEVELTAGFSPWRLVPCPARRRSGGTW